MVSIPRISKGPAGCRTVGSLLGLEYRQTVTYCRALCNSPALTRRSADFDFGLWRVCFPVSLGPARAGDCPCRDSESGQARPGRADSESEAPPGRVRSPSLPVSPAVRSPSPAAGPGSPSPVPGPEGRATCSSRSHHPKKNGGRGNIQGLRQKRAGGEGAWSGRDNKGRNRTANIDCCGQDGKEDGLRGQVGPVAAISVRTLYLCRRRKNPYGHGFRQWHRKACHAPVRLKGAAALSPCTARI